MGGSVSGTIGKGKTVSLGSVTFGGEISGTLNLSLSITGNSGNTYTGTITGTGAQSGSGPTFTPSGTGTITLVAGTPTSYSGYLNFTATDSAGKNVTGTGKLSGTDTSGTQVINTGSWNANLTDETTALDVWQPTNGSNWSTAANWSPGVVPSTVDATTYVAVFDGGTNSACTVDANTSEDAIMLRNGYNATITVAPGVTFNANYYENAFGTSTNQFNVQFQAPGRFQMPGVLSFNGGNALMGNFDFGDSGNNPGSVVFGGTTAMTVYAGYLNGPTCKDFCDMELASTSYMYLGQSATNAGASQLTLNGSTSFTVDSGAILTGYSTWNTLNTTIIGQGGSYVSSLYIEGVAGFVAPSSIIHSTGIIAVPTYVDGGNLYLGGNPGGNQSPWGAYGF